LAYCFFQKIKKVPIRIILLVLVTVGVFFPVFAIAQTSVENGPAVKIDSHRIIGRWVRPDGGYILEFKDIGDDGKLTAAYYNPGPINIFRAELRDDNGTINIVVELRDANYPGSTYTLQYDAETDRMVGTYFQAVGKITYDILFIRNK